MAERDLRSLQTTLADVQYQMEELRKTNAELASNREKVASENIDMCRSLAEMETKTSQLTQVKNTLSRQLSEAQRSADEEARGRSTLAVKVRNLEDELSTIKV